MTAEIAIINRSGIAVAADSAATIGRRRVWKSANKLFSMGPAHDIGIMFYGAADLFGCHWEIVVKEFRKSIKDKKIKTVEDCSTLFLDFLKSPQWGDERSQQVASAHLIAKCIEEIGDGLEYDTAMQFRDAVKAESKLLVKDISDNSIAIDDVTKKDFSTEYREIIRKFSSDILKQKMVKPVLDAIEDYVYEFFRRSECKSGYETGLVIFGFGDEEKFPSLKEFVIDGECLKKLRVWHRRSVNLNNSDSRGAIVPFAQSDMASLFMESISPIYLSYFISSLDGALSAKDNSFIGSYVPDSEKIVEGVLREKENEKIMDDFIKGYSALKQSEMINPMIESIHALPRDEMAAMAEAFIDLTSMRRKVDSALDTVGGPVDVAVISKGEGFIWIKRKMYFDNTLNPDYRDRRRAQLQRRG